jgi:hypothetical protein
MVCPSSRRRMTGSFCSRGGVHKGQRRPGALAGRVVAELDPAQCDGTGGAGRVCGIFEIEAGITQCFRGDLVRGRVGMVGQVAPGPAGHLRGALG